MTLPTTFGISVRDMLRATPAGLRALAQVAHTHGAAPQPAPTPPRQRFVRGDGKVYDKRTGAWR